MTNKKTPHLTTQAVRVGLCSDKQHRALVPPIYLSATYALPGLNQKGEYDYSRTTNPTRNTLGRAIAELEHGHTGIITNTGMSAVLLVCQLLNPDDTVVIPHDCYGGTYRLFTHLAARGLFQLDIVDQNDAHALSRALSSAENRPKLVWIETPSNPLLRIYDIAAIAKQAKAAGALVAVDNTFLSPILQQPLGLGADIVVHSCTKFINGHSDVVAGAVVVREQAIGETLSWWANCLGVTGSAMDSYWVMRSLRTLPARLRCHQENTEQIVEFLSHHPAIKTLYYPGLTTHPQHALAKTQQLGFGSLVSFELVGDEAARQRFSEALQIFTLAQSLGGVESLINHPASMTHAAMPDDAKITAGISPALWRLSIGIEHPDDLINDLRNALATVAP
ncbi:cystathionine gamma-synthase [Ostreibacterium oceani]|uniref:Cystathionine gamma-synthase n=1 Tax=Ostreibacterium oceani TaxID=2654998 RepID=A0A6N7F001_9GAMM|nr:cystathionine gamma-synthase [Ostreibacterium oceani]MPV85166.1 cystathionine gamma-synthase [Ostreibacterium oceani]